MKHPCPVLSPSRVLVTSLLLAVCMPALARDEAPLYPQDEATAQQLALRLPDLPLPDLNLDLRRLGDLRLPVPAPGEMHIYAHWYLPFQTLGLKFGTMMARFDDYSSRPAMGIVTSGRFNINPLTLFSLEMELMGTNTLLPGADSGAGVWSASTFGLFAAFRIGDPVFLKLRTGWMATNIYRTSPYEERYLSSASTPLGLGIGWRAGPTMIMETEVTWTRDISMVSFGILF